ncbi:MAG: hypothetical protein EAZ24_05710 [Burkholderiales bacterium]|nr:MAG: hypothetical protein EAZ24_05710 [Burkholderiales bacterium]
MSWKNRVAAKTSVNQHSLEHLAQYSQFMRYRSEIGERVTLHSLVCIATFTSSARTARENAAQRAHDSVRFTTLAQPH